ncbi:MAG: sigma-70 family RNA polymerase sigma factor [Lachnospiraceae bacterium]|nr:sigma-70 family RNA polymerase sigma factor [Lachnospiraceae bacterium]
MLDLRMDSLIRLAKERDADAFTALMDAQTAGMYKVARAILQNDEDAADAIGDTILVCWEKLETLKENRYFKTWLTRILINHCYEILRSRSRFSGAEEIPEISGRDDYRIEWKEALSTLTEEYREVIVLYYSQGFRTKEIARILGIPQATVRTRLSRAREHLAEYYKG